MKNILIAVVVLFFTGCEVNDIPDREMVSSDYYTPSDGRFDLKKVQSFQDNNAYNCNRSIFILTDKKTGKEYVGVSGVGIAETGSHSSGKSTLSDER